MIDFWKDYDGQSETPPIRGYLAQHSTFFNNYSFEGLDFERIKAYCKATGKEYEKQAINAKFMNEMEDWYLRLAQEAILISNDATNGDVIKTMFPSIDFTEMAFTVHATTSVASNGVKGSISYDFWKDWWNAPYKGVE